MRMHCQRSWQEIESAKSAEIDYLKKELSKSRLQVADTKNAFLGMQSKLKSISQAADSIRKDYSGHVSQSRRELDSFGHDIRRDYQSTIITKLKVRTPHWCTSPHCMCECEAADHNVCMIYQSVQSEIIAVTSKYRKEMLERKKLHNIIQDLKGNIRVFLRL